MIFGSLERGRLGLQTHQFKLVLTAKTSSSRLVFLWSLILKIKKTGLLVQSFSGPIHSSCSLFPVLRLDFHTLCIHDVAVIDTGNVAVTVVNEVGEMPLPTWVMC